MIKIKHRVLFDLLAKHGSVCSPGRSPVYMLITFRNVTVASCVDHWPIGSLNDGRPRNNRPLYSIRALFLRYLRVFLTLLSLIRVYNSYNHWHLHSVDSLSRFDFLRSPGSLNYKVVGLGTLTYSHSLQAIAPNHLTVSSHPRDDRRFHPLSPTTSGLFNNPVQDMI